MTLLLFFATCITVVHGQGFFQARSNGPSCCLDGTCVTLNAQFCSQRQGTWLQGACTPSTCKSKAANSLTALAPSFKALSPSPNSFTLPTRACCLPNGHCETLTVQMCNMRSGSSQAGSCAEIKCARGTPPLDITSQTACPESACGAKPVFPAFCHTSCQRNAAWRCEWKVDCDPTFDSGVGLGSDCHRRCLQRPNLDMDMCQRGCACVDQCVQQRQMQAISITMIEQNCERECRMEFEDDDKHCDYDTCRDCKAASCAWHTTDECLPYCRTDGTCLTVNEMCPAIAIPDLDILQRPCDYDTCGECMAVHCAWHTTNECLPYCRPDGTCLGANDKCPAIAIPDLDILQRPCDYDTCGECMAVHCAWHTTNECLPYCRQDGTCLGSNDKCPAVAIPDIDIKQRPCNYDTCQECMAVNCAWHTTNECLPYCRTDGTCLGANDRCPAIGGPDIIQAPCPLHLPQVPCFVNPCDVTKCPRWPGAVCRPNYCGGCNAEWWFEGRQVDCDKPDTDDCHCTILRIRAITTCLDRNMQLVKCDHKSGLQHFGLKPHGSGGHSIVFRGVGECKWCLAWDPTTGQLSFQPCGQAHQDFHLRAPSSAKKTLGLRQIELGSTGQCLEGGTSSASVVPCASKSKAQLWSIEPVV